MLQILAVIGRYGPHLMTVMLFVTQNNFKNGPGISDHLLGFYLAFFFQAFVVGSLLTLCGPSFAGPGGSPLYSLLSRCRSPTPISHLASQHRVSIAPRSRHFLLDNSYLLLRQSYSMQLSPLHLPATTDPSHSDTNELTT